MLLVAARIAEVDFPVVDDGVSPVGDEDAAIGAHRDANGAERRIARAYEVGLGLGDVARLRLGVGGEVIEGKTNDAVSTEVIRDGIALPFRAKEGALDDF